MKVAGGVSSSNPPTPSSDIAPPAERWRVVLPAGLIGSIEVYVNGVPQVEGADYEREPGALAFVRPLAREGRLGFWRWLSMILGVAGTYRKNDSVDIVYHAGGRRVVASGLEIVAPDGSPAESG
jgi:hypothetical protein